MAFVTVWNLNSVIFFHDGSHNNAETSRTYVFLLQRNLPTSPFWSTSTLHHFCTFQATVLTMVDKLLTHCLANNNPDQFLNIKLDNLQPHLNHISDKGLIETLKHGIGYYQEALDNTSFSTFCNPIACCVKGHSLELADGKLYGDHQELSF